MKITKTRYHIRAPFTGGLTGLCLSLLFGVALVARAEDNTTNIVSGFGADLGGTDLIIGNTGTNNYGQIDSAGSVFNVGVFYIGATAAASNNAVLVTDAGSSLQVNDLSAVGVDGSFNTLTLANGGVATGGGFGIIGHNPGATGNRVVIAGAGSAWNLTNVTTGLFVGHDNSPVNSLILTNGGTATTAANGLLGNLAGSDGNNALITGAGSSWTMGQGLFIGNHGANNTLTIADGGALTNTFAGVIGTEAASGSNNVLVTGTGSVWRNPELQVGVKGSDNTFTVAAGAQVWTIGSALTGRIGSHTDGTSANNSVVVTGAGSFWQMDGQLFVGEYGSSNTLIITDGGKVASPRPIVGAGATGFASPDYNTMVVSGAGSTFVQTNSAGVPTANARIGSLGSFNRLFVTNGGFVHFAVETRIGSGGTSSNNSVLVSGGGSYLKTDEGALNVGRGGSGNNSLTVTDGGVVESVCGTLGSANCHNNTVTITGQGSVWNVSSCDLDIPRGLVTTSTNNQLILTDGGWLTNVVKLTVLGLDSAIRLDNGNIAATLVDMGADTILSGRGTIKANVTAAAASLVHPGLGAGDTSALVIDGTLSLAGTTRITLNRTNSPNASKLDVTGALTLDGTLTVVNDGPPLQAGDTFNIYSSATGVSGSFSATNLPSLGTGLQWAFDAIGGTLSVQGPPSVMEFSLSGSTLTLAWPPANLGWIAQSNSVSLVDSGSWFDIAGSGSVTNLNITIDSALTNVFYRLRQP